MLPQPNVQRLSHESQMLERECRISESGSGTEDSQQQESRTRTAFLSSMNHEIRTPLNGVLGYAELLLKDRHLTEGQRRHVERIWAAGSALLGVANDILNYATVDADLVAVEAAAFDLREMVRDASAAAERQAEGKGLAFECHLDPDLPRAVIGNRARVVQVLMNLLGNAVKFTAEGRVRLSVLAANRTDDRVGVRFTVADTGIGIADEQQTTLFDRRHGHDAQIRRQFGGAGLGLPVAKRLVEDMGGALFLESVVRLGSTVWFELPLPPVAEQPFRQEAHASFNGPARVLLVEDNDINQEIARSILESAGHLVDVASDGSQAVMAVQSAHYHVVLMDVQMPIMDGISATRVIRSLPGPECDVPIIALTANVLPEQVRSFKDAGMNDHMGKPFQRDQLIHVVNRWAADNINVVIHSLSGLARARA